MVRYKRRFWVLAACLSALAGFVDAIGFVKLGGLFVSFMSGNSTRLAVGLATGSHVAVIAGSLIFAFVVGVVLGTMAGNAARARRKPAVLSLVGVMLALAAVLDQQAHDLAATLVMAAAMGVENAVFQRDGEVSIGVTYMTGTLVKFGQRLAAALMGGQPFGWIPYLLLWCGLAGGALAGAFLYPRLGPLSLWLAAGAAGIFAVLSVILPEDQPHTRNEAGN
ncbi:YoaK family protein [Azorhizobium oxalatiphilum]|nr:YoaK family protein [Azorhizobium oxalatiphilum]